ncbi:MAG: threonine--tRNA ligase, partial [Aquiluna sp.]
MEITLEGKTHQVSEGATGFDLFDNKDIIALRVNGELKDLAYPLNESDNVEGVDIRSKDGLDILRHSTAHLLAQAVMELYPGALPT